MYEHVRYLIATLALLVVSAGVLAAQEKPNAAAPQSALVELARAGKVPEAWKLWEGLPEGAAKQRVGIAIAGAAGQPQRAVELYDALTTNGQTPDREALRSVALSAASEIAKATENEARALGCSAILVLDPNQAACRRALTDMASVGEDTYLHALGTYALADAGIELEGRSLATIEPSLPLSSRAILVGMFTRIPPGLRVQTLQPLLTNPMSDAARRYQAVLMLASIPGDEAAGLLYRTDPQGLKNVLTVALAAHRDKQALADLPGILPDLSPYERVLAGKALAETLNPLGMEVLEAMRTNPVDLGRIRAAEALARINPDSAYRTLFEILSTGSLGIRTTALRAAGVVRMGSDRSVYNFVASRADDVQAAAIRAVADTLVVQPTQGPS